MSCEFEARVSLLIDGELSAEEAGRVEEHLAACDACRELALDFVRLGQTLRSYERAPQRSTEEALRAVIAARNGGFWSRRVSVPLSVAVAATLALASLGIWTAYRQISHDRRPVAVQPAEPNPETSMLDRFDRGEPAVLYKVRDERL